jgi:hypothetical protein
VNVEAILITCVLVIALTAPFFGLGYYRSWKVAGTVVLGLCVLAAFYAYGLATASADDAAANEWGARGAPGFFFSLAVILAVAFAVGVGARVVIERARTPRNGEISQ